VRVSFAKPIDPRALTSAAQARGSLNSIGSSSRRVARCMRACCCLRSRRSARLAFVQALRAGAVVPLKGWSLTDVAAASDGACLRANRSLCACDRHAHATDATAHEASIAQRSAVQCVRAGEVGGAGGAGTAAVLEVVYSPMFNEGAFRRQVSELPAAVRCIGAWCMLHVLCCMLSVAERCMLHVTFQQQVAHPRAGTRTHARTGC
jgi:hypothetical protein